LEDILDELMIDLFSLIADQVQNKQDLFDDEAKIMQMLLNNGYHINEADAALMLIQTLVKKEDDTFFTPALTAPSVHMRAMNREERERFSVEAFGFIAKLARLGIITEDQREAVLEKALMTYKERIELDHIKSLIAFALFSHPQDQEHDDFPSLRHIKKTAWN
jgi:uncharacterized protein Smg (DUF494 family)